VLAAAQAITVHSGDRREAASDSGAASERDELMEAWWLLPTFIAPTVIRSAYMNC